jgi:hypothetical protein
MAREICQQWGRVNMSRLVGFNRLTLRKLRNACQ